MICDGVSVRYTEAQENLEQAKVRVCAWLPCARNVTPLQEREIRIVGELKQSKEQYKRDTVKLSSERDALEDAGALLLLLLHVPYNARYLRKVTRPQF